MYYAHISRKEPPAKFRHMRLTGWSLFCAVFFAALLCVACTPEEQYTNVKEISLNKTSASLKVGETVTLSATVKPDDATDKSVTWSTSDATIATVSDGLVTAKKIGTASITAKAGDKTATCTITVVATPVTSVTLNKTSASLKVGETVTLSATVKPDDATDKSVTWSTADATIATVSDGLVTAKKLGTAIITAKAGDKTATCTITVVATPVTSISLNMSSVKMIVGEQIQLSASVLPVDATDKTVSWTSLDDNIAIVDNNGRITAKGKGQTKIVAKSSDGGQQAECELTVTDIQSGGIEDTIDVDIKI